MLGFNGLCRTEVSEYSLVQIRPDMFYLEIYQQQADILTVRKVLQQEPEERSRGCQEQFMGVKNSITADYFTVGKFGTVIQKIILELLHLKFSSESCESIMYSLKISNVKHKLYFTDP